MKRIIYKYPLKLGTQVVEIPEGSMFIHADIQGTKNELFMWADCPVGVDTTQKAELLVVGTGQQFDAIVPPVHLKTIMAPPFVWHVYAMPGVQLLQHVPSGGGGIMH